MLKYFIKTYKTFRHQPLLLSANTDLYQQWQVKPESAGRNAGQR